MHIRSVSFAAGGIISKRWMTGDYDPEKLLKDYEQEVDAIIEAVMAEEPELDLLLARLVEDMPGAARVALVKKVQELVRERDEQKAQVLQRYLEELEAQHKERSKEAKRQSWLSLFMSRETLRKIREALLSQPGMQAQVQDIGQELAKKGILQSVQYGSVQDLGDMAHNVAQSAPGFGKERDGRGA